MHSTSSQTGFHFDTQAIVARLQATGIPKEQADTLVAALADVVDESVAGLTTSLVSREEGERWRYTQKVGPNWLIDF